LCAGEESAVENAPTIARVEKIIARSLLRARRLAGETAVTRFPASRDLREGESRATPVSFLLLSLSFSLPSSIVGESSESNRGR
jgi:hypothetical protein